MLSTQDARNTVLAAALPLPGSMATDVAQGPLSQMNTGSAGLAATCSWAGTALFLATSPSLPKVGTLRAIT